ncbi:MAG: hypothetical protein QOJ30_2455 [Pseudonocardiales bacterium]|jgi:nitroimidazol reductase NimA-like FMN-containing flavoprotein (pyridoxamine 5'-phosphate oxidase superfamily)|nr:hypothetical protein [Pseudonocardiales bacterium]
MWDRAGLSGWTIEVTVLSRRGATKLVDLDRSQCLDLLRGTVIGRVVFTDSALPAAQPVTYLLDGEEIVFRTGQGTKLAAAARNAVIAFEVDDLDVDTRTGWSVLGVGRSYEVTEPRRWADLAARMPEPWIPASVAHVIAVPLSRLSGRRAGPAS